jgi:hypothetical protein
MLKDGDCDLPFGVHLLSESISSSAILKTQQATYNPVIDEDSDYELTWNIRDKRNNDKDLI